MNRGTLELKGRRWLSWKSEEKESEGCCLVDV